MLQSIAIFGVSIVTSKLQRRTPDSTGTEDWRHRISDSGADVWKGQDYYNPRIKDLLHRVFG